MKLFCRGCVPRNLHARIDFAASVFMLSAPCLLKLRRRSIGVSGLLGLCGLLIGSYTNYAFPLRRARLISWKAHCSIERVSLAASPLLFYAGAWRHPRDRAYLLALLLAYLYSHITTDWAEEHSRNGPDTVSHSGVPAETPECRTERAGG